MDGFDGFDFSDSRFLAVVRLLRSGRERQQAAVNALPTEEEQSEDPATRAVRVKIALRMKKRQAKEKR